MISKTQLIEKLVPQVIESFTMDDLVSFVSSRLQIDYLDDFDMLVEDALVYDLIEDEEEIV